LILKNVIRICVICSIAFAATVFLLRLPQRETAPQIPAQVSQSAPTTIQAKAPTSSEEDTSIAGRGTVIDGDTLDVMGIRIRLHGIDAPESGQTCTDAINKAYFCGSKAAFALADFIGEGIVRCQPLSKDQYRRTVARCFARGEDLGSFLVGAGWALDWPRYSHGEYARFQKDAQTAGRGMWAGKFVQPWNWRRCIRNHGQRGQCSAAN
jgi:endonuclease YncB( thermonuclease family)